MGTMDLIHTNNSLGECVPVTKTPIPCQAAVMFDSREDAHHTLFCGTKVIQTRTHGSTLVKAVVIRTGYMTAKGSLVRSILYPPPADFKFDQDSYKFIGVLAIIAAMGLIYTVIMKSEKGISPSDIAIKALDIITIVIPPALPAAMTVGKLYAQNRLKALNIFCMNSRVINVCGSINCVCFDKTGTLTEDGLDMWGVIPIESNQFKSPLRDVSQLSLGPLLFGMVSCHSNTIIDNKVSGDPLDIKMFESTRWILEEPEFTDTSRYGIHVSSVVRPPESSLAHNTERGIRLDGRVGEVDPLLRRQNLKHWGSNQILRDLKPVNITTEAVGYKLLTYFVV
uniref:Uncharacterized protein n=1 Tax=Timema shepardi TaxID=629360 RepID=A0A7R9B0T9_TIMSH|nr:unnamed protein product [Timema shepardi]